MESEAGTVLIEEHAALARARGKVLVVGEFGLATRADCPFRRFEAAARARIYGEWLQAARRVGAGAGPWLYAYRSRPSEWDDFTFYEGDELATAVAYAA